jgi:hypothetical protein
MRQDIRGGGSLNIDILELDDIRIHAESECNDALVAAVNKMFERLSGLENLPPRPLLDLLAAEAIRAAAEGVTEEDWLSDVASRHDPNALVPGLGDMRRQGLWPWKKEQP